MCHNVTMKTITLRELHEKTGAWVRQSRKYGELQVTDHGRVVARILPHEGDGERRTFSNWEPTPEYTRALARTRFTRDAGDAISEDRGEP